MEIREMLTTGTLALAIALAGHAYAAEPVQTSAPLVTAQKKIDDREAKRREAVAEQARKKEEFARRCVLPLVNEAEVEACKVLYRQM